MWIVEMHRDAAVDGEFDKFDCSDREWAAAGQLAQEFGWKPMGIVRRSREDPKGYLDPVYTPGMYGCWLPMVEEDDAIAWVEALDRAVAHLATSPGDWPKPSGPHLISESLSREQNAAINRGLGMDFLLAFMAYLRQGAFFFASDD